MKKIFLICFFGFILLIGALSISFYGLYKENAFGPLVTWTVNQSGHMAKKIEIGIDAGKFILKIGHLKIDDETKEFQLKGLETEYFLEQTDEVQTIFHLKIDEISFKDLTRPNESLKNILRKIYPQKRDRSCIVHLEIGLFSMGVSASAEPITLRNIVAKNICLDEDLTYESLNFESRDLKIIDHKIQFLAKPTHFWDIKSEKTLNFKLKPFLETDEVF
ncbi:MAG: hypothetical protein ACK5WZ_11880 [Pseudobdellovibrionaceae bacterium]